MRYSADMLLFLRKDCKGLMASTLVRGLAGASSAEVLTPAIAAKVPTLVM